MGVVYGGGKVVIGIVGTLDAVVVLDVTHKAIECPSSLGSARTWKGQPEVAVGVAEVAVGVAEREVLDLPLILA